MGDATGAMRAHFYQMGWRKKKLYAIGGHGKRCRVKYQQDKMQFGDIDANMGGGPAQCRGFFFGAIIRETMMRARP
jgi:hypothetical protein